MGTWLAMACCGGHGSPWRVMVHHGSQHGVLWWTWLAMACYGGHGSPWRAMVDMAHHGVLWWTWLAMACHGASWLPTWRVMLARLRGLHGSGLGSLASRPADLQTSRPPDLQTSKPADLVPICFYL